MLSLDFDLGFKDDFGKEADLGGGVKPAFAAAAAASESSSGAILKNGLSLSKSSILAWAPGGGAFAAAFVAGGDFTSGAPFGFGFTSADETDGVTVESAGKVASAMVESCPEEVEVGKAEAVETRGVLSATSSGSDPKSTSSCGAGGEGGTSAFASTGVVDILLNLSSTSDTSTVCHGSASVGISLSAGLSVRE